MDGARRDPAREDARAAGTVVVLPCYAVVLGPRRSGRAGRPGRRIPEAAAAESPRTGAACEDPPDSGRGASTYTFRLERAKTLKWRNLNRVPSARAWGRRNRGWEREASDAEAVQPKSSVRRRRVGHGFRDRVQRVCLRLLCGLLQRLQRFEP